MTENVVKTGPMIPISEMLMNDYTARAVFPELTIERWRRPDRNPMPPVVLFPWVQRAQDRLAEWRARAAAAVDVLRYGVPDEWDD